MRDLNLSKGILGFVVLSALPTAGLADTFVLRRDNVIPVSFEATLTVKDNRPGDIFFAKVGDTDQLPAGSELRGRIDRIHPARGNRPSSMDLRFTDLILPDHSRVALDASPLPLDDKYITRTGDGRIVAKQNIRQQQNDVLGGAIGGFIVGSILHRRVAGTILGTMVGVAVSQSDREKDANVVVNAGDRVGALINQDITIDFAPQPSRYDVNRRLDQGMNGPSRSNPGRIGDSRSDTDIFLNIHISFRNKELFFPFDAKPYRVGKDIMVPLDPTAQQLFLDVDRRQDRTIYVDGKDTSMHLTLYSRSARLNDRHFDLSRTVVERRGVVYVPLDALTALVKEDVLLNGTKFPGAQ
jgi:hypothetical protein